MNLADELKTELPNWRTSPCGDYMTADNGQHRVYFTDDDGHITASVCVARDVFVSGGRTLRQRRARPAARGTRAQRARHAGVALGR